MDDVLLDSGMNQCDGIRAFVMCETSSMSGAKQKLATTSIA